MKRSEVEERRRTHTQQHFSFFFPSSHFTIGTCLIFNFGPNRPSLFFFSGLDRLHNVGLLTIFLCFVFICSQIDSCWYIKLYLTFSSHEIIQKIRRYVNSVIVFEDMSTV